MTHPIRCYYVTGLPHPSPEERAQDLRAVERAWREMEAWLVSRTGRRVRFEPVRDTAVSEPVTPETCWGLAWRLAEFPGHNLFVVKGAGAWAGSNTVPQGGGVAVVGDAVIDELAGREPSACKVITKWGAPQCSRDGQLGAALHELLHTAGARHEDGGVMERWWEWPNTTVPMTPLLGERLSFWGRMGVWVRWYTNRLRGGK